MDLVRNKAGTVVHKPTCQFNRNGSKVRWEWAERFKYLNSLLSALDEAGLSGEVKPCAVCRPFSPERLVTDRVALNEISEILSAPGPWRVEYLEWIAEVVKKSGRRAG